MAIMQAFDNTQLGTGVGGLNAQIFGGTPWAELGIGTDVTYFDGGVIIGNPSSSRITVNGSFTGTTLDDLSGTVTQVDVLFNPGTTSQSRFLFGELSDPIQSWINDQVTLGGALSGNDTIIGTDVGDYSTSTSVRVGDNTAGFNGNDRYEAGGGADSWEVRGNRSDYTITGDADHSDGVIVTIADSVANRDGTDTLVDAEIVRFMGDSSIALVGASEDEATVARLYSAALGREPDYSGLSYWIMVSRSGVTTTEIADFFASSTEFQELYDGASNYDVVSQLYQNVLGRAAEAEGINFWTGHLDAGNSTLSEVLVGFADSVENIQNTTGLWIY